MHNPKQQSSATLRYTMRFGPGLAREVTCDHLADAVSTYCAARDRSGLGASRWPEGVIDTGSETLRVSYNGRVWRGTWPNAVEVRP